MFQNMLYADDTGIPTLTETLVVIMPLFFQSQVMNLLDKAKIGSLHFSPSLETALEMTTGRIIMVVWQWDVIHKLWAIMAH